ncbi:MAG TPA: hydrogenase maturation protease [Acidimicrobiales bacterium]|nr:hydrogenase maturation protease [Acidimicrobiales bacterium]
MTHRVVVAGIGSELRRDDGAGPAVVERIRRLGVPDDWALWSGPAPLDLLGLWAGCELAVVVDATHNDGEPGTIRVLEIDSASVDAGQGRAPGSTRGLNSTHGMGLVTVLQLARVVDRMPPRVVLVGIEGDDFGAGACLSPAVAGTVDEAAKKVFELARQATCMGGT